MDKQTISKTIEKYMLIINDLYKDIDYYKSINNFEKTIKLYEQIQDLEQSVEDLQDDLQELQELN